MNRFQLREYIYNTSNSTERLFHKIHKYYPDEIYMKLRQLGFSNESSFPPIQQDMDRLFALEKLKNEFQPTDYNPF